MKLTFAEPTCVVKCVTEVANMPSCHIFKNNYVVILTGNYLSINISVNYNEDKMRHKKKKLILKMFKVCSN